MASTTAELTWITFLLRHIGIKFDKAPKLFCDNMNALYMTINPMFHVRTKHIEMDYHFVREKVAVGALVTWFMPSTQQTMDIFTKPLSKLPFCNFRSKLGVHRSMHSSLMKDENENGKNCIDTESSMEITTMNLNQRQISFSIIWLNVWHSPMDSLCQESHKCRESNMFLFVSLLRQ